MPACSLHLLSLNVPLAEFLTALTRSSLQPLTVGRVHRWIILPTSLSAETLLGANIHWDVLVTVANTDPLPSALHKLVKHSWTVQAGIPSRITKDFAAKNDRLLSAKPEDAPALTGSLDKPRITSSAQGLELSPELFNWVRDFSGREGRGPVSMLNLLAFNPGMKEEYLKYGKAFAESIGSNRGGDAKLVGNVLDVQGQGKGGWDEIALAHYPSIMHFADMLASEDYQEVNHKHRVGSLKDTFILCTTELDLPWPGSARSRL